MRLTSCRILTGLFGVAGICLGAFQTQANPIPLSSTWSVNAYNNPAPNGVHVTLSGQSATGYTYSGTGTGGLPGTTLPDSRRRPKVYQDFAAFNAGGVGSTLSMTYDIKWGGTANPPAVNAGWRFGFVSSTANGGKGVSLGANFDLGNLGGSVFYEFFADPSVTSGLGGSSTMDSAFTETLNDPLDIIGRDGSNAVPPGNNVAFNDRVKTHRVTLTFQRIVDGYNLDFAWQNLAVGGTTITDSFVIDSMSPDPAFALAAGVTNWDRLGFFVNSDSVATGSPWVYTLSDLRVDGMAIPEPSSVCLALFCLASVVGTGRTRSR